MFYSRKKCSTHTLYITIYSHINLRLPRRPPSAACEPSRWNLVRNAVRVRSIAFYWLGETVATLCAPDGRYSLEDLEAFLRDLEE